MLTGFATAIRRRQVLDAGDLWRYGDPAMNIAAQFPLNPTASPTPADVRAEFLAIAEFITARQW